MVMEVPLTQGKVALIDDEDWPIVAPHKWTYLRTKGGAGGYAITSAVGDDGKKHMLSMHRLLLGAKPGQWVDHKHHNGIDNRRCEIRLCTPSQNAQNRKRARGKIPVRGVTEAQYGPGFVAGISADGACYRLGVFPTIEDAGRAYDAACRVLHGEFGHLNYPDLPAVELGPLSVVYGRPHPALAHLVRPNEREAGRAKRLAAYAERKRLSAEIAAANAIVIAKLPARDAEIASAFLKTASLTKAGAIVGLTRERVRQIIARAEGRGLVRPLEAQKRRSRVPEAFKAHAIELVAIVGLKRAAKHLRVAESCLRAWSDAAGVRRRQVGRPGVVRERANASFLAELKAA
jgi:hypothetical protein